MEQHEAERRERGRQTFADVMGFPSPDSPGVFPNVGVLETVFAEVWSRGGLTRKERRWITLAGVGAAGGTASLEQHLRAALTSGDITIDELDEFLLQFAVYNGFPRASVILGVLRQVVKDLEELGDTSPQSGST